MPPKILTGETYAFNVDPKIRVRVKLIGEMRIGIGLKSVAIVYEDLRDSTIHVRRSSEFRALFSKTAEPIHHGE